MVYSMNYGFHFQSPTSIGRSSRDTDNVSGSPLPESATEGQASSRIEIQSLPAHMYDSIYNPPSVVDPQKYANRRKPKKSGLELERRRTHVCTYDGESMYAQEVYVQRRTVDGFGRVRLRRHRRRHLHMIIVVRWPFRLRETLHERDPFESSRQ